MNDTSQLSLNTDRLGAYLSTRIDGFKTILNATKFSGGQSNPTFLITTESDKYVLRQKPLGPLLKSAHAIDREYRVLQALKNSDVPIANPYIFCEDEEVIGSEFYIMTYVPGRIFWKPLVEGISVKDRVALFNNIIQTLAVLHSIDPQNAGLSDFGSTGNYFERQFHRWSSQYKMSETSHIAEMDQLIRELPKQLPLEPHWTSLIHGDYRIDNLIFHQQESKVVAIIDWELSTLGDSISDLAYFCMCLRMRPDQHIAGIAGLNRASLGIPEESEMIQLYCKLRGIGSINHWDFYLAFSFFRLAAICQGVLKRSLDGTASNSDAIHIGNLTCTLAQMAVEGLDDNV